MLTIGHVNVYPVPDSGTNLVARATVDVGPAVLSGLLIFKGDSGRLRVVPSREYHPKGREGSLEIERAVLGAYLAEIGVRPRLYAPAVGA